MSYAFFIEPNQLNITTYEYQTDKLNNGQKLKIAFLSDLHIGSPFNDLQRLDKIVNKTNSLNPDIILLGGDYIVTDVPLGKYVDIGEILKPLSKLEAPLGVYAVMGNHEYKKEGVDFDKLFKEHHIPLLRNENISFKDFSLTAIDFKYNYDNSDIIKLKNDKLNIAFSHAPSIFNLINEESIILTGHEHGGQFNLPFIGSIIFLYLSGEIHHIKTEKQDFNKTMFTSRGIGTSRIPLRFLSKPEIMVVDISN